MFDRGLNKQSLENILMQHLHSHQSIEVRNEQL